MSLFVVPAVAEEGEATFAGHIQPFLKQYCHDCHGEHAQEALVRLDQMDGFRGEERNLWTMVHQKLDAGEMPPEDSLQPGDSEARQVLHWIVQRQRSLRDSGIRRLNRRELGGALGELTGLAVNFADALPGDARVAGFDTVAEGLQDSAESVAQVVRITRRAVDGIRFVEPSPGQVFSADLQEATDPRRAFEHWRDEGGEVRSGLLRPYDGPGLVIQPRWVGERDQVQCTVAAPPNEQGLLRVELVVSAMKPFQELPNPHLWVRVSGKDVAYQEITGTPQQPQRLIYLVQLDDLAIGSKGVSIQLSNKVELPYGVEGFENEDRTKPDEVPGGGGLYRPEFDRRELSLEEWPAPFVVLHQIELESGYVAAWPPSQWLADVGVSRHEQLDDSPGTAGRLLDLWIRRAWRRPVGQSEQEPFLALYRQLRRQGLSFDDALRAAFQSVLLSAPFRYLTSPADADDRIAQHAIASRLSFMLVGEPPDDVLRELAAAGRLREPAVLDAQVGRLLDDPRSRAFLEPFVIQWLEMDQPITIAMSHLQKQDFRFARHLKASMREETIAYVAQMLADNRPAGELLDSDWTMMNDALALHYGYAGIEGAHLRPVKLRPDDPRGGGILAHAGIQSMLCWMGESWVIFRGAWALRHILDMPPPPPPLEVPELDPSEGSNRGKTFRQLLQQHQEDSRCSVCHKNMDPLGFAFQNFDISGRWRDREYERYTMSELDGKIAWRGAGEARPVDAAGRLPRGEEFTDYAEFKQQMANNYQADLVRGLMKNWIVYSTGRTPDVDTLGEIRTMMEQLESQGYPLRDLLKAVVRSQAFLDQEPP